MSQFDELGPEDMPDVDDAGVDLGPFVDVVVSNGVECGLRSAGVVQCWRGVGQLLVDVVDVDASSVTVCALTADHDVHCWGDREPFLSTYASPGWVELRVGEGSVCGVDAMGLWSCESGVDVTALAPIADLVVGAADELCALDPMGALTCTFEDQLTDAIDGSRRYVDVSLANAATGLCAVDDQGEVHCLQGHGAGLRTWMAPPDAVSVSVGRRVTGEDDGLCVGLSSGLLWCSEPSILEQDAIAVDLVGTRTCWLLSTEEIACDG